MSGMLVTLFITVIIILICVVLLSVKVIFKKNGRFPNTHIEGNKELAKKGIYCAKTEDRLQRRQQNLIDRLNEQMK